MKWIVLPSLCKKAIGLIWKKTTAKWLNEQMDFYFLLFNLSHLLSAENCVLVQLEYLCSAPFIQHVSAELMNIRGRYSLIKTK